MMIPKSLGQESSGMLKSLVGGISKSKQKLRIWMHGDAKKGIF
jgi:hypothetical protein